MRKKEALMDYSILRFWTAVFFLLAEALAFYAIADGDGIDISYRENFSDERWREKHQYRGRNSGGWSHSNWYGGVDQDPQEEGTVYYYYPKYYPYFFLHPPPTPPEEGQEEDEENNPEDLEENPQEP